MSDFYKIKAVMKDNTVLFARSQTLTISVGTGISSVTYTYTKPDGASGSGVVGKTTTLDTCIKTKFVFSYTLSSGYKISKSTSSITIQGNQYVYFEGTSSSTGGGGGCVTAKTPILVSLDGTTKDAESMVVGAKLIAYDEATDKFIETEIEQRYVMKDSTRIITFTLDDASELSITPKHRIMTDKGLISFDDTNGNEQIVLGTKLKGLNGYRTVVGVRMEQKDDDAIVYNYKTKRGTAFLADGIIVENQPDNEETRNGVAVMSLSGSDISKGHV